jgi:hypothetical protein
MAQIVHHTLKKWFTSVTSLGLYRCNKKQTIEIKQFYFKRKKHKDLKIINQLYSNYGPHSAPYITHNFKVTWIIYAPDTVSKLDQSL